ncbi:uncharacterized protein LOC131172108 [Hevea brasiliensis]|uniref:uncharacterized protein LOC131172108 n=1 Tax=Hevea brasiliensis TaxID=3981 RepID=UPI0025F3792A|nr:uncharacterized protein LOC131172108 [Hevea brasiliensis]
MVSKLLPFTPLSLYPQPNNSFVSSSTQFQVLIVLFYCFFFFLNLFEIFLFLQLHASLYESLSDKANPNPKLCFLPILVLISFLHPICCCYCSFTFWIEKKFSFILQEVSVGNSKNKVNLIMPPRTGSKPMRELIYELDEIQEAMQLEPHLSNVKAIEKCFCRACP